jgi:hypothetical protein
LLTWILMIREEVVYFRASYSLQDTSGAAWNSDRGILTALRVCGGIPDWEGEPGLESSRPMPAPGWPYPLCLRSSPALRSPEPSRPHRRPRRGRRGS